MSAFGKGRATFGKRGEKPTLAGALNQTRKARYLKTAGAPETTDATPDPSAPDDLGIDYARLNGLDLSNSKAQDNAWIADEPDTGKTGSIFFLPPDEPAKTRADRTVPKERLAAMKSTLMPLVMDRIDMSALVGLDRNDLEEALEPAILEEAGRRNIHFNQDELLALRRAIAYELIGFGPLEPLLEDPTVNDILVNGADKVYAERNGRLEITEITFRDNDHVMQIANRICNWVGRRVDVSSPMADARLPDGSRVNCIVPPLALRGPSISIRKFNKHKMGLLDLVKRGALSRNMADFLQIVTNSRFNVLISGGTGSGKTTLLNALSQYIDPTERVVTIEDSAELQLSQPHVVPLETRPSNLEGSGKITIRDLIANALRMRPDRIVVGEVRGEECFDMLQAFNTGHDGGMCTLHSNSPREAISRMENLVAMAKPNYPTIAVREQIADTIDIVVQVKRMRDGVRRITDIVEVVGMNGDIITTQSLFSYDLVSGETDENVRGDFVYSGHMLRAAAKVREAGLGRALKEALK